MNVSTQPLVAFVTMSDRMRSRLALMYAVKKERISRRRKKRENAVSMIQTVGGCNPAVLDVMSCEPQ